MSITRENYEAFFLDYLEGSLDSSLMEEMDAFLRRNPDLKEELEEYEQVLLPVDPVYFDGKEQLKKIVTARDNQEDKRFEHLCIAKLEGDLTGDEGKALDQMLVDQPDRKKELELYFKTKLRPSPVIFPDKNLLKREVPVFRNKYSWYAVSAAASVILILVFTLLLNRFRVPQEEQVAVVTQTETTRYAAVEEETINMEEEISVSGDQPLVDRIHSEKEPLVNEGAGEVAASVFEPALGKEEEAIPAKAADLDIGAGRTINIEPLTRREFVQVKTTPEINLAIAAAKEKEMGIEEEYLTLREMVGHRLRRVVSSEEPGKTGQEDKITFLDIADAGVRGINRITGTDMKLNRQYDQNGELTYYAFTSKSLSFSHEVKK